jgi:peptidoglycan/LPS O-acetylase OafA/YrhL
VAKNKPALKRNFGLDLLRSVAISIVLINHAFIGLFLANGAARWEGWKTAWSASAVFSIEWLFILSGFLIGSMMIRSFETRSTWWGRAKDFWLRRWFRTLPNYYLFLLVNVLLVAWGIAEGRFSFKFVVFSQNLAWAEDQPLFFAEAWSLALDEWFYFVMPLLLGIAGLLIGSWGQRAFFIVALLLIAVPTVLRFTVAPAAGFFEWDAHIRRVTVMHLDATGWGVLAAILSKWQPQWWARRAGTKAVLGALLTLGAVVAMFSFMLHDWRWLAGGWLNDTLLIAMPAIGVVLLLPWLTSLQVRARWALWLAARVGDYSYSVYLSHFPLVWVFNWGMRQAGLDFAAWSWVIVALWVLTVFAVSALVFHSFEKPLSDLRERFTRRVQAGPFG